MGCFSPAKSESQSQSAAKTSRQTAELEKAFDIYSPLVGQGTQVFPGERVSPLSDLQQGAITGAEGALDFFSTPQTVGTPLTAETGQALTGLLSGETGAKPLTNVDVSSFFQSAIRDPAMKSLREDINPAIDESFAGPGFFGSSRSQARVKAATDVSDRLGTAEAQLRFDVLRQNQALEEARASRTLGAVPTAISFGQQPARETLNNIQIAAGKVQGLQNIFGFGQAEQTQAQRELTDEIARFVEENQITDPENLAIFMALLGQNFATSTGQSSSSGAGLGYVGATAAASAYGTALAGG